MLNITRRPRETVVITCPDGTRLEVTILGVQGTNVRIGFDAPKSYVIDRYEVDHRKAREAAGVPKEGREPRGPQWAPVEEQ